MAFTLALNLTEPGGFDIHSWQDRIRLIDAQYPGKWELPAIGVVSPPRAVLIRPDGYVPWVGDSTGLGLADASGLGADVQLKMANVILFHSVLGLRDIELGIGDDLRAAGHTVALPDLYQGDTAENMIDGFEIKEKVGWNVICARARCALATLQKTTVLAGISMGAGVVAEVWPLQPLTAGILLLHGLADIPSNMKSRLPIELHVSDSDPLFSQRDVDSWQSEAERLGAEVEVFRYANAGHYFLDPALPDYSKEASTAVRERISKFLDKMDDR